MGTRLVLVQSLVEKSLKKAIRLAAFEKEKSVSEEIRETLRRVYLADQVTLELPENRAVLVDSPTPYTTEGEQ